MKRSIIAASLALVFFVMPSTSNAVEPVYCEGCQNTPTTQPGCNGLQSDRSGGGVSRWSASLNGVDTYYEVDYTLASPGTWNVNYHFDIYDNRGVKTGSVDLPGAQINVSPGSTWSGTATGSISLASTGDTVQLTVTAVSDIGGFFNGWGQTDNLGCTVVF